GPCGVERHRNECDGEHRRDGSPQTPQAPHVCDTCCGLWGEKQHPPRGGSGGCFETRAIRASAVWLRAASSVFSQSSQVTPNAVSIPPIVGGTMLLGGVEPRPSTTALPSRASIVAAQAVPCVAASDSASIAAKANPASARLIFDMSCPLSA